MKRALFPALALILVLGLALSMAVPALAQSASVWTDKQDYAPEEVVTISGSDFLANAEVTVTVERPDGVTDTVTPAPITDDTGYFTCTYQLDGIAGTYTVTATDGTNTAVTTFTDTTALISITVSPTSVAAGSTTSFTVNVSVPSGDYHTLASVEISMAAVSGSNWGTPGSVSITGFYQAASWSVYSTGAGLLRIYVNSPGGGRTLDPGETMTVTFSVQAPSAGGTSTWSVTGYQPKTFTTPSDTKTQDVTVTGAADTTAPTVTINQALGQADPT